MPNETSTQQMHQAAVELFERYEREFNEGLNGKADLEAIARLYASSFIGASPAGVFAGRNDDELRKVTVEGFKHYRATGVQQMKVRHLDVSPIDDLHGLARVGWSATYRTGDMQKVIDFTNVYLVRVEDSRGQVFGWITGDEAAELRKHGIGQ